MQIKWQQPRPALPDLPTTPSVSNVRHNVFIKTDRASPDGDRPNVLVGGFPNTGAGSEDRYEIYGNFFFHNPRESLLQTSGRVSIHDNVFVDVAGTAVLVQNHDLPLRQAFVYDNTIYAAGTGIRFGNAAPQGDAVFGNLIFAGTATAGTISDLRDNVSDSLANAALYVSAPSTMLGEMDFYPLAGGRAQGTALDMAEVVGDTDYDRDFNGTDRGAFTFRGAYAGEGTNPGWQLADDLIGMTDPPTRTDGGTPPDGGGGTTPREDGGTTPRTDAGGVMPSADDGGCACTAPGARDASTRNGAGPCGAAALVAHRGHRSAAATGCRLPLSRSALDAGRVCRARRPHAADTLHSRPEGRVYGRTTVGARAAKCRGLGRAVGRTSIGAISAAGTVVVGNPNAAAALVRRRPAVEEPLVTARLAYVRVRIGGGVVVDACVGCVDQHSQIAAILRAPVAARRGGRTTAREEHHGDRQEPRSSATGHRSLLRRTLDSRWR